MARGFSGLSPVKKMRDLARHATQTRKWWRFLLLKRVWWVRIVLALVMGAFIVAAHLYLANQAVVLWEDIRTMQYDAWKLWWEIVTWQTDLAEQRNAHFVWSVVEESGLTWPEPGSVLYVPVDMPGKIMRTESIPGVWSPPPTPETKLPSAYTISGSQWLAHGGWDRLRQRLGLPPTNPAP